MNNKQKNAIIILILILVIADQILKITILLSNIKIGNEDSWGIGIINTEKTKNNISYILIAIIAIGVLIRYINSNNSYVKMDSRIILSFAIAGVISNTIGRLWKGYVINYINIPNFTPLNLSYLYIAVTWVGMAVILTKFTKNNHHQLKKERNKNENR